MWVYLCRLFSRTRYQVVCPITEKQDTRDNYWVVGVRNDSASDFEAMYRYYYEHLCQFAFRFVQNHAAAEDLVHNVFLNIWKNRTKWNPKGTLVSYLFRSVKNQAFKYLAHRKVQNRSNIEDLSMLPDQNRMNPEEKYWGEEFEESVRKAVEQLPERRRTIWLMHREDKLTYHEIAMILDISVKTVETQMSRSLKFLRSRLSDFLPLIATLLTFFH